MSDQIDATESAKTYGTGWQKILLVAYAALIFVGLVLGGSAGLAIDTFEKADDAVPTSLWVQFWTGSGIIVVCILIFVGIAVIEIRLHREE